MTLISRTIDTQLHHHQAEKASTDNKSDVRAGKMSCMLETDVTDAFKRYSSASFHCIDEVFLHRPRALHMDVRPIFSIGKRSTVRSL